MASLLLFLLPIAVLTPLFISFWVFRFWFPKHILKLSQAVMLPAGICVFLLSNIIQIYFLTTLLPLSCFKSSVLLFETVASKFGDHSVFNFVVVGLFLFSFAFMPAVITALLSHLLRKAWEYSVVNPEAKGFRYLVGAKVGELFFNYMGQLTAYNPQEEELVVDVLTTDGYLFCGIYSDYFLDAEGKLVGVSITNAIRHRITYDSMGKRLDPDSYIIPNQGEIFFPVEKVNNFHIWRMKQNHIFETNLSKPHNAIVAAWYVAVRFVSEIKVRVRLTGDNFPTENVRLFFDCLDRLGIVPDDNALEFEETEKK